MHLEVTADLGLGGESGNRFPTDTEVQLGTGFMQRQHRQPPRFLDSCCRHGYWKRWIVASLPSSPCLLNYPLQNWGALIRVQHYCKIYNQNSPFLQDCPHNGKRTLAQMVGQQQEWDFSRSSSHQCFSILSPSTDHRCEAPFGTVSA